MVLSRLRVLVFPESIRWWTARSLEHDIAAGGRSAEAALDSVVKIAQAHIAFDVRHGREPLSAFAPAPRPYWNAFPAGARSSFEMELLHPADGPSIRVIAARLTHHPAIDATRVIRSRDAVVAPFERQANLFFGPDHDSGDAVVSERFGDARGYRRAVAGARM
jgi:hypothetical protein